MSFVRLWHVIWLDLKLHLRRPLFLILLLLLAVTAWGLKGGEVQISAGDSAVGGQKAWITSEHSIAYLISLITVLYYGFFVSVGAGLAIPHDEELKVGEVLHATPLTTGEYIWGKFIAVLAAFCVIMMIQMLLMMFFMYVLPEGSDDRIVGPFALSNFLKPALLFALPTIIFTAGITFAIGEFTRRPVLVFFFPVAMILLLAFFLWDWSPSWLDPRLNSALQWIDPSGFRWLNEVQLKVDRGVEYYNTQPIAFDTGFLLSRLGFCLVGLGAVALSGRHYRRTLRGSKAMPRARKGIAASISNEPAPSAHAETGSVAALAMSQRTPSWFAEMFHVARFEFRGLVTSPGMYLFIPLITLQSLPNIYFRQGPFGTFQQITSGSFAAGTLNGLAIMVGMLLLFYTVESVNRERATGIWPLVHTTPMRASSWLTGKALANTYIAALVLVVEFLGFLMLLAFQGSGRIELLPFGILWIGLLAPTFFVWTTWTILLLAVTGSRYLTYALALGTLIGTGWMVGRGMMNWVFDWILFNSGRWSDLGGLEMNLHPLILNRVLWLSIGALFIALTVKVYERREFDATRIVHRLQPRQLLRASLRLVPFFVLPFVLASYMGLQIAAGPGGARMEDRQHNYWKQNLATWNDVLPPAIAHAQADLRLEPAANAFALKGSYTLENVDDEPMRKFAITLGHHITEASWTLDGEVYEPEDRTNLFVFTPDQPMPKGGRVTVGFEYAATLPGGMRKRFAGGGEFIEQSGAVIQGWSPTVFPTLGWNPGIGVKGDENSYEPREYPEDYYKEQVNTAFGSRTPFTTHIRIDVPEAYRANSNGELIEETVADGRRIAVWQSDHPVMMFNVVAGKWSVVRGEGTEIFYHPAHERNIEEMLQALNGARQYYSEWFYPYPWKELKLSEFANHAGYAQGFATNITFSESIGFLTRSDFRARAAFVVAAHEAAHQWWGNTLVPGDGPGGNILSEGMSHFSTILLCEQVKGLQARIEFFKRIEESYALERVVDSERALVRIQGDKPGDTTVTYDKGGMVFYMLHRLMGREANFAGIQAFIRNRHDNPDRPLLEDFVEEMRPFAPDAAAFDAFTRQWFFEVVAPLYKLDDVTRQQEGSTWVVTGTLRNAGSGRQSVEVSAASQEERFEEQSEEEARREPAPVSASYVDARQVLSLGAGESASFRLECSFEPSFVCLDPDATVLMIDRKKAVVRF